MQDPIGQRTMRKIYVRALPFAILTYFLCYIDRINVGFAALTMNKDLGLDSAMFGIFGCGSSRNTATCPASKPGRLAIDAKGGASPVVPCWSPATTWHGSHQRRAICPPL